MAHANLSLSVSYFGHHPLQGTEREFSGLLSPFIGCSHTIFATGCSKHEAFSVYLLYYFGQETEEGTSKG